MTGWLEQLFEIGHSKVNHVIVTLVEIKGSAPQIVGAKMIVTEHGLHFGTVGGGKIEAHCIRLAQEFIQAGVPAQLQTYNLQKDIGMTCGGEVSLFFDTHFFTQWTIAIFGAGHVSQELCRILQTWSCQVKVFDTRQEWLNKLGHSSNIETKLTTDLANEVKFLPQGTFLLSLTQGHSADVPVLEMALKLRERFRFIGVIGSDIKGQRIKSELSALGVAQKALDFLKCPVGLDIGDNTPPEIALSIAAQILIIKSDKEISIKEQGIK